MVRLTLIARASDGLPLAEGLDAAAGGRDHALENAKQQARAVYKSLAGSSSRSGGGGMGGFGGANGCGGGGASTSSSSSSYSRQTVDAGGNSLLLHVLYNPESDVAFVAVADRPYPKKLAYQFLDELAGEFGRLYPASTVAAAARPYAFVKFDTFIQKTKRLYADARTSRNIAALTRELGEVQSIMTRTIADVLGQGERLDSMSAAAATLTSETAGFAKRARALHRQALVRKYAPMAAVVGGLLFFLWLRKKLF